MNYFENFRQQNQHLFGEDSDYSDTEPDFDPEESFFRLLVDIAKWKRFPKKKLEKNFERKIQKNFEKKNFEKNFFASKNAKKSPQHEKSKKIFFFGQIGLQFLAPYW